MNNFDDLFEQQPQAEAAPQKQESRKERPKRQWWQVKEEKQRKEAYATLDKIFGEFSEGAGSMEAYLDVQSRFPFHSARNALLIGEQCPDAVRVGGYKEWHSQGIEILEDEKRLPIVILEPGKYESEDFYQDHKTIHFDTLDSFGEYEVIAAFKTVAYSEQGFKYYHFVRAEQEEDFDEFIAKCKELALYDTGVTAEYGDQLITLSTCEYSRTNGRMVVVAKLLEE